MVGPITWEALGNTHWTLIGWQSVVAIGSGLGTALVIGGALPVLENLFGVTTNITWLELADLNHPLLRRMTIEAPGTYHHSLVVAQLAEAAAEAIGANPAIARVSAYFHDIGKLVKPEYFTENMRYGRNPHDELAPTMSALIILAHVKEGVDLALKNRLNQQIVDAIQQHHGTSLVFYFYKRALQQQEDARQGGKIMNIREEDIPDVREESFRYPGPKPQTQGMRHPLAGRRHRKRLALHRKDHAAEDRPAHRRHRAKAPARRPAFRLRPLPARARRRRRELQEHPAQHDAQPRRLPKRPHQREARHPKPDQAAEFAAGVGGVGGVGSTNPEEPKAHGRLIP